jgi:hypothetical protein
MPWQDFDAKDDSYIVNWVGVTQILRSYLHSKAALANSTLRQSENLIGPKLSLVDVDWGKVRAYKEAQIETELRDFYMTAKTKGMPDAVDKLKDCIRREREFDHALTGKMLAASKMSSDAVKASVSSGESALVGLQWLRDGSAEVLVAAATVVSGGTAAAAAIAGAALLKGGGKWQDTGNAKAAVVEAGVTATFGACGIKFKESGLIMQVVLSKIQGLLDVPKAVLEGQDVASGVKTGAMKMAAASGQEFAKEGVVALLENSGKYKNAAYILQGAINVAVDKIPGMLVEPAADPPSPAPKQADENLLDAAYFGKRMIYARAVQPVKSGSWLKPE